MAQELIDALKKQKSQDDDLVKRTDDLGTGKPSFEKRTNPTFKAQKKEEILEKEALSKPEENSIGCFTAFFRRHFPSLCTQTTNPPLLSQNRPGLYS